MTRKTANDFHPEVLKLFDQYVHGQSSHRDFLTGAALAWHRTMAFFNKHLRN